MSGNKKDSHQTNNSDGKPRIVGKQRTTRKTVAPVKGDGGGIPPTPKGEGASTIRMDDPDSRPGSSRTRGPPPKPPTQETPPIDEPMYVPSTTFSTTDGSMASGVTFEPTLISQRLPLCTEHAGLDLRIPYFCEVLDVQPATTFGLHDVRQDVSLDVLHTLKLMKRRRDFPKTNLDTNAALTDDSDPAELLICCEPDSDNDIAHLVLGYKEPCDETISLDVRDVSIDLPINRGEGLTIINGVEHECYSCYDRAYRLQRRVNVDYCFKMHEIGKTEAERHISMKTFNTVIYAPEGSGKTTFCTLSRFYGFDILECNNLFDWPDDLSNSLLLTSNPDHLRLGRNKICLKPDCATFYERQQLRSSQIRDYRVKEYSLFTRIPPETIIIRTNKVVSELFS